MTVAQGLINFYTVFLDHTQRRSTATWSPAEIVDSNRTGGMDICLL